MKIGLLPLYIDIYDISSPHVRPRMKAFYEKIASDFEARGVAVEQAEDFCRLKPEFEKAVASFEAAKVDAIVTLHMAYSPSLEAIDTLAGTKLPIIVLDTTETLTFTNEQSPGEIMYNHGIHGVMDLCSMLKRYGKPYAIAAGHYEQSDVIDEACGLVRAAVAAQAVSGAHVGLIGGAFESMGDFAVEPKELQERFGITVEEFAPEALTQYAVKVSDAEIDAEYKLDRERFAFPEEIDVDAYKRSVAVGLGLRKCVEEKGLNAFSVNFRTVREMPFMECCKAMERGIGYAGEGDGLTSAFVGALLQGYPETNFVEIFCPDWENDMLFLSHMGEMNYRIADTKPTVAHKGGFVDTYAAYARMKGGKGVFVNVSRDRDDYKLVLSPCQMLPFEKDNFEGSMRGWLKPGNGKTTAEFLKAISVHGATHHSAFVYGATLEELEYFGALLLMKTVVI
ncbi:MAG: hypothetical protein J5482_03380 [Oscillospiraceae bacterium]|nr:hypothetical protein [Oscillospiraceae bacterium]